MSTPLLRVTSRQVARDLSQLLGQVAAGQVIEIIDGRRRDAKVRAVLTASAEPTAPGKDA